MVPIADSSKPGSTTPPEETLQWEVGSVRICSGPKTKIHLGTWDVCTVYETCKLAQVSSEMWRYKLLHPANQVIEVVPGLLHLKHGAENKHWRFRHVLRVDRDRVRKVALRWTPPGKRINRRAKTTWQHADLRSADGNTGGGTTHGTDECKELQPCVPMRTKRIKLVNNLSSCAFKINLQVLHGKNQYSSVCCCSGLSVLQSYAAEPFQSRLNEQRAALGCLSFKLYTALRN